MDGRMLTHDKSSHGLWPGELKNMCVYDHPIDPIIQLATLTFFISNYSTLIFASDPINFYTEFG
jgi:hypothetical protein